MASARDIDAEQDPAASTTERESGLDDNVAGALSYLFNIISGLILFFVKKDNPFVRWHAAQSIAFNVLLGIVYFVLFIAQIFVSVIFSGITGGFILWGIISLILSLVWLAVALGSFVTWIYLMIKAYQGETLRLPVAAGIADRLA